MRRPLVTVKPGHWVTSTAGRDKGTHYIVLAVRDGRWIDVVDGRRRTLANPKKKSIKHVWVHDVVVDHLAARFEAGEKVSDEEIQSALAQLVREEEEVG